MRDIIDRVVEEEARVWANGTHTRQQPSNVWRWLVYGIMATGLVVASFGAGAVTPRAPVDLSTTGNDLTLVILLCAMIGGGRAALIATLAAFVISISELWPLDAIDLLWLGGHASLWGAITLFAWAAGPEPLWRKWRRT